jgi:hypothetical protein
MMPTTMYWLDEKLPPWMQWVWQKDKPLSLGEDLFEPYCLRFPHGASQYAGDRAYVDPDGWVEAALKVYKWFSEGYAHAGVFSFNPWDVDLLCYQTAPVVRPVILAVDRKETTFFSGEKARRTLFVYNHTLVDRVFVLTVRLGEDPKPVYAQTTSFSLPGGEKKEFPLEMDLPKVDSKQELVFTAGLHEAGRPVTEGERMVWSVFPPPAKLPWPKESIAVVAGDARLQAELKGTGMKHTVAKDVAQAVASKPKGILLYGARISDEAGRKLSEYVTGGGRVVMANVPNGSYLPGGAAISGNGTHFAAHAFPAVAKHTALEGLRAEDLHVWRPDTYVCRETFTKPLGTALRVILDAGGLTGMRWAPMMELRLGQGRFLLSQMNLAGRIGVEPAAAYLLCNLVRAALRPMEEKPGTVCLYASKDAPLRAFLAARGISPADASKARVSLIDGALPPVELTAALNASRQRGGTVVLHGLTPATASVAAKALGVPIALTEKKLNQVVRAGRHPILDGLSNDDFFWNRGQFGVDWPQFRIKPNAVLCESVLDLSADPDWTALTEPAALAVRDVDGLRVVLDQLRWDKALDKEKDRCLRIGGTLLANLGVEITPDRAWSERTFTFVDLRKVTNRGFVDEKADDGAGGWFDGGPKWDMRFFPVNLVGVDRKGYKCPKEAFPQRSTMGECDFGLINPESNAGKSCIVIGKGKGLKAGSGDIAVNDSAKALWILHGAQVGWNKDKPFDVAEMTVTFADGSTAAATLKNTVHLADWRSGNAVDQGEFGWQGYCVRHDPVAVYVCRWQNPSPDKKIRQVSFNAKGDGEYALIGLTLEK